MNETVSSLAIGGMIFTLIISIGLPIALMLICWKKLPGKLMPVLIGAGTFIVFALVLESIFHAVVLGATGERITGNILLYALYAGLAAGIFEETGRFLSMKFLMKRTLSKENSIMYGIGHGGIEAVLLVGLTSISNLAVAIMINAGALDVILGGLDEPMRTQTFNQLSTLWTTPAGVFYLGGVERIAAITLHICLSYIVYRAIKDKRPSLFVLAVAIHLVVDAGTVLLTNAVSMYALEAILIVVVAILAVLVYKRYKAEPKTELAAGPIDELEANLAMGPQTMPQAAPPMVQYPVAPAMPPNATPAAIPTEPSDAPTTEPYSTRY